MTTYKWNILETYSDGIYINSVKYQLTATDDDLSVSTEGYYNFPKEDKYLINDTLMQGHVCDWISDLSNGQIKLCLDSQLEQLKSKGKLVSPPWHIETYTPGQ